MYREFRNSDGSLACIQTADGTSSFTEGNPEWDKYQEWLALGNTVQPDTAYELSQTLESQKYKKGFELWQDMSPGYLYKRYDAGTQSTFLARYIKLMADPVGNAAKLALLDSVDAWMKQVLMYYYGKKMEVVGATSYTELDAITWDFPASFDASDPLVTIPQVI